MTSKVLTESFNIYPSMIDPSQLFRPNHKAINKFRHFTNYKDDPIQRRVQETYLQMHTYQTVKLVKEREKYWCQFDKMKLGIMDALDKLNNLIDESDPDVDFPNIIHAFQTGEKIKEKHPNLDWFHLTGLIHDLGKIMAFYGEPQWAVVGDTFPVGCIFADSIVYRETSFIQNEDLFDSRYNTKYGIYSPNCGLDKVIMSWGHDEYLYRVLKNHQKCTLPEESLYIIRYHSFYPWHESNDYLHLCNDKDMKMLKWIKEFNQFDLYSKSDEMLDIEKIKPYYQSLIDKYIPGLVDW